jgi:Cytochrome P460
VLLVLSCAAISAQDKYTLQVPGGLAFSEFRGYEGWPVIAISENEGLIAVIVGNPVMIDAYKEGVPGNGKTVPDGAKMAKIHWNPKKQEAYPGQPTVPGTLHDVDFMVKDSKSSRTAMDGDGARSTMTPRPTRSRPLPWLPSRRRVTMPNVGSRATRW